MSFLHTRDAGALVSRCQQCGHVIRARMDRDVFAEQRAHSWLSCQQRRAETTRVVEAARARAAALAAEVAGAAEARCLNGHLRAGNTSISNRGHLVCLACQRERWAAKKGCAEARVSRSGTTVSRGSADRIGTDEEAPDLTPRPLLSNAPDRYERQEGA